MLIHELHSALSRSLGDPVAYNAAGSTREDKLVNGVRYTVAIRDQYLTQAMRSIQLSAMRQVAALPREAANHVLAGLFPTSTARYDWDGAVDGMDIPAAVNTKILWIYSAIVASTTEGNLTADKVVLPILNAYEMPRISYGRTPLQKPDNAAFVFNTGTATNLKIESTTIAEPVIEIFYLPKAVEISTLAATDTVPFEEMWLEQVAFRASLYGQNDSQELGVASQAVPLIMQQGAATQGGQ